MTIKEMRKLTGLTQTEFGIKCGNIPLRTIQNWENKVSVPPDYVVFLIEKFLLSENLIQ